MSGKRIRVLAVVLALCMFVGCMTYAEEVPTAAPETTVVETEQPTESEAPAADATVGVAEEPATGTTEVAPATTDAAPATTDAAPATTDAAPATTDAAPATTDAAPATTDAAPATTDAAPATTDAAPATTDAAPATTDAAPATTDAAPATTDAAPEDVTEEECTHKHVIEWDYFDDGDCTPKDSKSHTVTGHMSHEKVCGDCGETLETTVDEKETSRVEAHWFEDGACEECGYESGCAHKYTGTRTRSDWSEDEELECTPVDETNHIFRGDLYQETFCLTCGEVLKNEVIENGIEGIEEHQFNYDGGCWICGYEKNKCRHENTVEGEDPDYAYAEVKSFDEDGHTLVISAKIVSEECKDCGEVVSERRVKIEPYEEIIGHYFEGESCTTCGYANPCEHKTTYVDTYDDDTVMSFDAEGHTVAVYRYKGTFCEDCDTALDVTLDEIGRFETSAHTFEDGVCTVCDYEKTEADPTMPTVTDEPVVTPTPTMPAVTDTPKATKKPAEKPAEATEAPAEPVWAEKTIAEIVTQMDADVAAQGGSIRIVNAEKVLTPDELTALNALPVKEQLLTFLSVIGVEEPVNRMLAERQESLSAEAEALKALVLARIAAMDDAAREDFDITLLDCFPEEAVTINGVEYNFFVIDLEVRTDDGVRYERYGFRREGDEWIFACLEVAE